MPLAVIPPRFPVIPARFYSHPRASGDLAMVALSQDPRLRGDDYKKGAGMT